MKRRSTRKQRQLKKRRITLVIFGLIFLALLTIGSSLYIYISQTVTVPATSTKNEQILDEISDSGLEDKVIKVIMDNSEFEEGLQRKKNRDSKEKPKSEAELEKEVEIVFAGDTMFDWGLRPLLEEKGYNYPFNDVKYSIKEADYSFVNAETVFTENPGTKDPDQLFWINSDLRGLQAIEDAGFTMINIGNNHTLDYMESGLLDTLENVKKTNMDFIGAGEDAEEAYESKEITIKGKKFRFFSFVRFFPNFNWVATENKAGVTNGYDLDLVKQTIEEQKADADYVIVYFHWGIEQTNMPADYQKDYVKALEEVGVDLIVGSHPHWLQGFEYYNDMAVAYSIGNFLFPPYVTGKSAKTGLLKARFKEGTVKLAFEPYKIDNGQIIPVKKTVKQEMLTYLQSISFNVEIDEKGNIRNAP